MMTNRLAVILFLLNFFCISRVYSEPIVHIFQGTLNGTIEQTVSGRYFSSFFGIPYAEPPIKDLRFRSPVPAKSWDGVRMARKSGNSCPQIEDEDIVGDEDCLYLNVHTPFQKFEPSMIKDTSNKNLLPVMVWIHGGAFVGGTCNLFNAGYLLDKDVILISINYRLGIFGFLSTGDLAAPGNFGMKDQVLALKWIQKNIRAFGGDPNRVTLFGESAGGASVSLHAFSDASKGLFHQYIAQSGSALDPWAYQKRAYFRVYISQLAFLVGCPLINSHIVVECLRRKSVHQLLGTSTIFQTFARFAQLTWTPTDEPESKDAFLTDSPENLLAQNKVRDYPFIVGNVVNEGLLITRSMYSSSTLYNTIRFGLDLVLNYFSSYYLKPRNVFSFTNKIKWFYFKKSIFSSKKEFIEGITRFITDGFFLYPEMKLIENLSRKSKEPAYFYNFGYQGSQTSRARNYEDGMVGHADELQYLFPFNFTIIKDTDLEAVNLMVDLWTTFATNGKPTSALLNSDLWQPYKPENTNYLRIGGTSLDSKPIVTLENSYFTERMNFWKKNAN